MGTMARARTLLCLCLWALVGCDCGDEELGRVLPQLKVATDPLSFGEVPLGATKRLFVEVSNEGQAVLQIDAVDAELPFGAELLHTSIEPGDSAVVEVFFRPTNDEAQSGLLTLVSNDPRQMMVTVPLSGLGVQGFLTIAPASVDFSQSKLGGTRSIELLVNNRGLEAIQGSLQTGAFEQPEHFDLTLVPAFGGSGPVAVSGRSSLQLDFEYHPRSIGEHNGRILLEFCGQNCGLEVQVVASAADSTVRLRPAIVDFGDVGIGETRTEQLRIENGGDAPVQVTQVQVLGSADLAVQVSRDLPTTLAAGDSLGINVEYLPTSASDVQGQVEVRTGPIVEVVRASVVGRGVGPLFRVEPDALHFGVERTPGTYGRVLLLVNAGSSDVQVTNISVAGDPAFRVGTLAGLPVRLGSGESLSVPMEFSPTTIGEYQGVAIVESDDALNARVEVPMTGALSDRYCELNISPDRVNFGLLPPTFSRTHTVTVRNVGTDPCNIIGAEFRAPAVPAITELTDPWPAALAPGEVMALGFQYSPVLQARAKATYVMHTDDEVFPERTIGIFGTSEGNLDVFAQPGTVDFGSIGLGCRESRQDVVLINAGTVGVTISSLTLTSSTPEFRVSTPLSTPVSLPAGGTRLFQVAYQAQDFGMDQAYVEIGVQDFGFSLNVPLRGEGSASPRVTEIFQQTQNDKVDVLFVIDDSCSMQDDQAALAANFRSFIRQGDLRSVDFHIGITTTTVDPTDPGHLEGPVMSSATRNLESEFQSQAAVGVQGSGFEQGLEGMYLAYLVGDQGGNEQAKLLRPDASRVVIIVSDEDDQSPLPVATYFSELAARSPQGYVTAMVTGGPAGCVSQGAGSGSAQPALRYADFTSLTGGLDESICTGWAQTLSSIGQAAFGLRYKFPLPRGAASGAPILVWVDGTPVTSGWVYDPIDGSVTFNQPPPEGSEIRIEYTPVC